VDNSFTKGRSWPFYTRETKPLNRLFFQKRIYLSRATHSPVDNIRYNTKEEGASGASSEGRGASPSNLAFGLSHPLTTGG
jgi:hypothetical protein